MNKIDLFVQQERTQKHNILLDLFIKIKDANEHCAYIFTQLQSAPHLFTDKLMIEIYTEAVELEKKGVEKLRKKELWAISSIQEKIEHIKEQEKREEEWDCESLLDEL